MSEQEWQDAYAMRNEECEHLQAELNEYRALEFKGSLDELHTNQAKSGLKNIELYNKCKQLQAELAEKHERVRYFENRNTQLATENMNQEEEIARLKEALEKVVKLSFRNRHRLTLCEEIRNVAEQALKGGAG